MKTGLRIILPGRPWCSVGIENAKDLDIYKVGFGGVCLLRETKSHKRNKSELNTSVLEVKD